MKISKEEVRNIAMLARIGLTEEETDRTEKDLGAILGFVARLQGIDTTGVPEASAIPIEADNFRADGVFGVSPSERAFILDNFPASEGGMLKAPAVFGNPKR